MASSLPHIVIAGTGAMACLFGARLSAAGVPVTLMGTWAAGLRALRRDGVRVVEPDGRENVYAVRTATDPHKVQKSNLALVCVKSWQTERASRQLAGCLAGDGVALTLQNGMGNYEAMEKFLGPQRAALGTTTTGANMLSPGVVRSGGEGIISLEDHLRTQLLREVFSYAGFAVQVVADPIELLWGKLVINAAINPLTALLRVPNGGLLERPQARMLMSAAAKEAAAVAAAQGVRLPYPDPAAAAESVAARTSSNLSSMLQDILRGSPTEIDAISGAVVQIGDAAGVATPVNRTLWNLVRALEMSSGKAPIQGRRKFKRLVKNKSQISAGMIGKPNNQAL
jgi:2-dehydropantoate 2-reductase